MKDNILSFIALILIIIVFIMWCHHDIKENYLEWNNGQCQCGGRWEYQQAVGHAYSTGYLYKCDSCGKFMIAIKNVVRRQKL